MSQIVLRAERVSASYGQRVALRDVSFALAEGQLLTLIGPNGSGKSTLIKSVLGLIRATGTIEWDGRPLSQWRPRHLARLVAYLPQSPTADADQTVSDVLRLGRAPYLRAFGLESERDLQIVHDIAALLGITDLLDRPIDELSGGQRQSVFLGRCLVQQPKALLLDEPNTYLDLKHQLDLVLLLKRLARTKNLAVLMASHDLNLAAATSDHLILLNQGTQAASGAAHEVLTPDLLSAVYQTPITRLDREGPPIVFPTIPAE